MIICIEEKSCGLSQENRLKGSMLHKSGACTSVVYVHIYLYSNDAWNCNCFLCMTPPPVQQIKVHYFLFSLKKNMRFSEKYSRLPESSPYLVAADGPHSQQMYRINLIPFGLSPHIPVVEKSC